MRGRKQKPTATKKLTGTLQRCRTNPDEPQVDLMAVAICPEHLQNDEVAVEAWNYYAPRLIAVKVLTELDLDTLANFCALVSDLRELRDNLKEYGRLVYTEKMGEDGNKYYEAKSNPAAVQYNNLLTQFRGYASNLGLDPTSRPRLKVEGRKEAVEENLLDV